MGNYNSFNTALNIITRLPKDLQYNCLFFLKKDEYYAIVRGLKLSFRLGMYYTYCESELIDSNTPEQYYELIDKFNIPFKFVVKYQTEETIEYLNSIGAKYSNDSNDWNIIGNRQKIMRYLKRPSKYSVAININYFGKKRILLVGHYKFDFFYI